MGVSYLHEDGLLILECEGSFTLEEARQVVKDGLKSFPGQGSPALLISDPSSPFAPPAEEVPYMAQSLADTLPHIKPQVALYVDSDVKFGIGRMIGIHCEEIGVNLRVFRDLQEAKDWLRQF